MAYAEKRGKFWRARWTGPDGRLESASGFEKKSAALEFGRAQEAAIRNNTYRDPRASSMTLTEWVNVWFPSLDLEMSTLHSYRYHIEMHILPEFGDWDLRALERAPEEIAKWERGLPVSRRTAQEARSTLTNLLNDAIPRYLSTNPAARKRGKGKKGQRRIAEAAQRERAWATPTQALLLAERCALLAGSDLDFILIVTAAFTGMRWSELMALAPSALGPGKIEVGWKLYELDGRFYSGRPKDGSIRTLDSPSFLDDLLSRVKPSVVTVREGGVVPGSGVLVPVLGRGSLPPLELRCAVLPGGSGRLVPEKVVEAARPAGSGRRRRRLPGVARAAVAGR